MPPAGENLRIEEQFDLARWSAGNALLVGLALTLGVLWLVVWCYRHEARGSLTPWRRRGLTACRAAVLLLLGLIGLEPIRVRYVHRRVDAATVVLVDESASMALIDRYRSAKSRAAVSGLARAGSASRAELAADLVGSDFLARLAKHNRVHLFGFSDRLRPIDTIAAATTRPTAPPTTAPTGGVTNIGAAVSQALDTLGETPVAAVVLLSDGQANDGEPLEAVGRMLKARGVPLLAVGLGDAATPVNVRVSEVTAPRMVFKDDPFQVTAYVSTEGLEAADVELELREIEPGATGEGAVVQRRKVRPRADGQFDPVVFERKRAKPGEVRYVVRAAPREEETILNDNSAEAMPAMRVIENRVRVLLVAGAPSYDYRYVARLLSRDKTFDASCWLQSADETAVREGTTPIDHLPTKPEELFAYDAVLLFDPDPTGLPAGWAKQLDALVSEHGGGLFYQAGRKFTSDFFRARSVAPIVDLLPIVRDPDAELVLNELGIYQRKNWPMRLTDEARGGTLMRLSDAASEDERAWSLFEGSYWHFPVRREKPAASVLLRHSNPKMANAAGAHILMATQIVGAGRTAWLGFDDTWRWRRVGEGYFARFWVQLVRFLVEGKVLGSDHRGQITTDRDRYNQGDPVTVRVRLLDAKFQPLILPNLSVSLRPADQPARPLALEPIEGRPGHYQGRFVAERVGLTRLSLELPGATGGEAAVHRDVAVVESNLELARPVMQRAALTALAEATGGRYFEAGAAAALPEAIEDRGQTVVTPERPRPLWDNAYVLTALIGLLAIEWTLRRMANLL